MVTRISMDHRAFSCNLPDTLQLIYGSKFQVTIPSAAGSVGRYFVMQGGAYRSEIVGTPSSLTLPNSNYFSNVVVTAAAYYRFVEIEEVEFKFVPASFHVGSSWVGFGRNQALITENDVGFSTNDDLVQGPDVFTYEYNEPFRLAFRPSSYARSQGVPVKMKSGLITNPDDFQYDPLGTKYLVANFSKPQGVLNPGTQTYLGDVYMRWSVRFHGRMPL